MGPCLREKETAASSALSAAMERDKRCGPDKIRTHDLQGYGGSLVAGCCHCTAGRQVLKHPVGSVPALRPPRDFVGGFRSCFLQETESSHSGRPGQLSRYNDSLRAGRSGYRIPVEAKSSMPLQTGPKAHLVPCTTGSGSFPWSPRFCGLERGAEACQRRGILECDTFAVRWI